MTETMSTTFDVDKFLSGATISNGRDQFVAKEGRTHNSRLKVITFRYTDDPDGVTRISSEDGACPNCHRLSCSGSLKVREDQVRIADGHNPKSLTEDQVGVKDGWRLLSEEERSFLYTNSVQNKDISDELEMWLEFSEEWVSREAQLGHRTYWIFCSNDTWRTKRPQGYYLAPSRSKTAEGYNPRNLTEFLVEVSVGWRLLSSEEREFLANRDPYDRERVSPLIEWWDGFKWSTVTSGGRWGFHDGYCYRTKEPVGAFLPKPKIAEGNNPQKLTEDQVGVKDGWRLLTSEEVDTPRDSLIADIERWSDDRRSWDNSHWSGNMRSCTYRTKKPAGFFLPKPKIAEGHNPRELTEEQVGVGNGWRLLTKEEHDALGRKPTDVRRAASRDIEWLTSWEDSVRWKPVTSGRQWGFGFFYADDTFRTKKPAGFFLKQVNYVTPGEAAPGWNTHMVTADQIGTGYRLVTCREWLSWGERVNAVAPAGIEYFNETKDQPWQERVGGYGLTTADTYRISVAVAPLTPES